MNKSVTSREQLLAAAKEIAYGQGLTHVNIRAVATKCGVAVGSIYNYFPTKADLVAAIIEDFWRQAIHREQCVPLENEPFPAYVERLYRELSGNLAAFQSGWLTQISALSTEERRKGRELEARCFSHMREGILAALPRDSGPFSGRETELADFVFRYMMALLREGKPDCAFLRALLQQLIP